MRERLLSSVTACDCSLYYPHFFLVLFLADTSSLDCDASLLLDARAIRAFAPGALVGVTHPGELASSSADESRSELWCALRLTEEGLMLETGLLERLCAPLGAAGVSVLVITTARTVYLLVLSTEVGMAATLLREHGFVVSLAPNNVHPA